ncbi:ThiF family adenylyltransferase [Krasilnikovia sp. MM14-A1004]|uniref:ThiF family adenylyltransferase n=1 Tax=Krasilnikovia sp. MM14-A1004 TaxID=3373541 RepID=UPI00399D1B04
MTDVAPSPGQQAAVRELRTIERITEGRIKVVREHDLDKANRLPIDLEIDCRGESAPGAAVTLQSWEPVTVFVPARYPFVHPDVEVEHDRFAHQPHVLWVHGICLYLAANDWDPTRGMRGFVSQLLTWFRAVAHGTLTDVEIPFHAPLTQLRTADHLVVRPDLPAELEDRKDLWFALAVVEATSTHVYEVRGWARPDQLRPLRHPFFLAPVVALPTPVGFTYPRNALELQLTLKRQRLPTQLFDALRLQIREIAAKGWEDAGGRPPDLLILGSPAPSRYAIDSRIGHIAVWRLGDFSLLPVLGNAFVRVAWVNVHDQRPRITRRRDSMRPARWLAGKRVLVLGCGALGAPAAEFCVRGGASHIILVDDKDVSPGILVRQPYAQYDIGRNKAMASAVRMIEISADCKVEPMPGDALEMFLPGGSPPAVDLIIDATANRAVAAALERARWTSAEPPPPLLSMMVGHDCEYGVATLALPDASGSGVDILRRLAITASTDEDLHDVLDDLFPAHPRTALFQPEPGCSDPTYVGSAADMSTFAGQMLNDGLSVLTSAGEAGRGTAFPQRWASVVRTSSMTPAPGGPRLRQWADDDVRPRRNSGTTAPYQVRVEPAVWATMRREAALMAGRRGPHVETGGLLLGQIDRASRVVWVTEAGGLPPGSVAEDRRLELEPAVARRLAAERRRATRGMVAYIGTWHTHPDDAARPSADDETAMRKIVADGGPALLIILGGTEGRLSRWVEGGSRPQRYVKLYLPD